MPDQKVLSDRVKTAIKTALATVLAYGVALSMDWEHAYWTAFAVAFCTLSRWHKLHTYLGKIPAKVPYCSRMPPFQNRRT
jgi:hypothetical protein